MKSEKPANIGPKHWTAKSADDLAHAIAFDFIAQLEQRFESNEASQVDVARALGISKSAVCKVLNNPQNLTLKTIAKYSLALGLKPAIVAYDDDDYNQNKGLIPGALFGQSWENLGKPRDAWAMEEAKAKASGTTTVFKDYFPQHQIAVHSNRTLGSKTSFGPWSNSGTSTTAEPLPVVS